MAIFPKGTVPKTIVAIDLTDSTAMKEQQPEVAWLGTYDWFFSMLSSTISPYHGQIVKYLGDGGMAVFPVDNAAEAINWAIKVQESIGDGRADNLIACDCSIGIASGEVKEFDVPEGAAGQKDYIGTVVDRAFRLCGAVNAKGIFVDEYTCDAASMTKVVSRLGSSMSMKRNAQLYKGERETIKLKGLSTPVAYHEILWDSIRYGVRGKTVTEISTAKAPAPPEKVITGATRVGAAVPARPVRGPGWMIGVVDRYDEKTFGFITAEGESFFVYPGAVFRKGATLRKGDEVGFIPGEAAAGSSTDGKVKKRPALFVIPVGTTLNGRLARNGKDGTYGFAICKSDKGEEAPNIFVHFGGRKEPYAPGTEIEFRMARGPRGDFAGEDVKDKAATASA